MKRLNLLIIILFTILLFTFSRTLKKFKTKQEKPFYHMKPCDEHDVKALVLASQTPNLNSNNDKDFPDKLGLIYYEFINKFSRKDKTYNVQAIMGFSHSNGNEWKITLIRQEIKNSFKFTEWFTTLITKLFYFEHHAIFLFSQRMNKRVIKDCEKFQGYTEFANEEMVLYDKVKWNSVSDITKFIRFLKSLGLEEKHIDEQDNMLELFNVLQHIRRYGHLEILNKIFSNKDSVVFQTLLNNDSDSRDKIKNMLKGFNSFTPKMLILFDKHRDFIKTVFKITDEKIMLEIVYLIDHSTDDLRSQALFKNVGTTLSELQNFKDFISKPNTTNDSILYPEEFVKEFKQKKNKEYLSYLF
jgi:hypothetical protein